MQAFYLTIMGCQRAYKSKITNEEKEKMIDYKGTYSAQWPKGKRTNNDPLNTTQKTKEQHEPH